MQNAWKLANEKLQERKITNKKQHDKNLNVIEFKVNDLVLVKAFTKQEKFQETWNGPYRIVEVPSEAYVIIRNGRKNEKIHKDNIKHAKGRYEKVPPEIILNTNQIIEFVKQF